MFGKASGRASDEIRLTPPDDGARNVVAINGRVYSSVPGVAISVLQFDASALEASGWSKAVGAATPTTTSSYAGGAVSGIISASAGSPTGLGVRLYLDGSSIPAGTMAADADGAWSISTGALALGPHRFSVEIDESAGSFVIGANPGPGTMDFSQPSNSGLLAAVAA